MLSSLLQLLQTIKSKIFVLSAETMRGMMKTIGEFNV